MLTWINMIWSAQIFPRLQFEKRSLQGTNRCPSVVGPVEILLKEVLLYRP
jgi:hypothetical protein